MKQYLILIEQLVREGKSEAEIEKIVSELVQEDGDSLEERIDLELPAAA